MQTKKADAVGFDAPVLLFYAANEGKGKVEIVGSILREESYGIVLPNNSQYRKPINLSSFSPLLPTPCPIASSPLPTPHSLL